MQSQVFEMWPVPIVHAVTSGAKAQNTSAIDMKVASNM
jgi:hypothetical protein